MTDPLKHPWGRVDDTGSVYVIDDGSERLIGQLPDGSAEEALGYFERKYDEFKVQIDLVEQRVAKAAPAHDLAHTLSGLAESLKDAAALGDLNALRSRVAGLRTKVEELAGQQSKRAEEAHAQALADRTAIVEQMEGVAATDPATVQWKQASKRVDDLFRQWQQHQREGARLTKSEATALWKRFRAARSTFEHHRRAFFASLDATHKEARIAKQKLVDEVEGLVPEGASATEAYQRLLREWKRSGRAGKKVDDALWSRFKAAGDKIYAAKAEVVEQENAEYEKNLETKLALLVEAEKLVAGPDQANARTELTRIQRDWEEVGRVPRSRFREVESRLRKVETQVRQREDEHWNRTDPEKQARSESMESQLLAIIGQLENELAEAKKSGNQRRIDKAAQDLAARRAWLEALGA